ncbi:ribonuclease H-like domain-containing protein [Tanacetum coccineum]
MLCGRRRIPVLHLEYSRGEGLSTLNALDKCQLGDEVRSKEGKLDTPVTENGENWSVGQRQLVCLGRVLLKKSKVLVLDEATASVDTATDGMIQQTLNQHFNDSTVIMIAHRITSVLDSDMVLVLEQGLIEEYDSPTKLLEDKSSSFAKLVAEYSMRSKGNVFMYLNSFKHFTHPSSGSNTKSLQFSSIRLSRFGVFPSRMVLASLDSEHSRGEGAKDVKWQYWLGYISHSASRAWQKHTHKIISVDRCNAVVLSWLLSSISEDLYLSQVYFENAAEVWKELKDTYDKLNGFILFNLIQKINSFKQNGLPVSEYYHKLNSLWREFDMLTKSSLLTQPELPDVKDAFVIVCKEESHRGLGSTSGVPKPQVSSFVAKTGDNFKGQNRNSNNFNNQNGTNRNQSNSYNTNNNGTNRTQYNSLSYKNCGMKGHTIDRCFEIIGYPPGFKKNSNGSFGNNNNKGLSNNNNTGGSSNHVETQTQNGSLPFTNDQILKLMSLIGEKENSGVHANMAGANQHITNSTKNMTNVIDISDLNITVGHLNGTIAKIHHVGNLKLTNNVVLFDVLVIPEYTDLKKGDCSGDW